MVLTEDVKWEGRRAPPAFDTLKATQVLREAGVEEAKAEAIVTTIGRAMSENVATKADVAEINANMAAFHAAVDARFAEVKADADVRFAETRAGADARFAEVNAGMAALRAEFANEFKTLYRHLWVMGASIVAVTVMLVKLIP